MQARSPTPPNQRRTEASPKRFHLQGWSLLEMWELNGDSELHGARNATSHSVVIWQNEHVSYMTPESPLFSLSHPYESASLILEVKAFL